MTTRRTFLVTGLAGGAALAAAGWLRGAPALAASASAGPATLDADAAAIVAAIVPVMLDGALPAEPGQRQRARDATVASVGDAIAGLPPAAQKELAELFALLGFAPARVLLAGVSSRWPEAAPQEVAAFLARWRGSRFMLLRSAYDALHQLVYAAWYANRLAWPAIGYPGPPAL